ncbi:MAG: transposase [Gemmataceae bacterium]
MRTLSREQQLSVLSLLVEGNSLRSITRLTGIHRTSIMRLMSRVGAQLREFLDQRMRNLQLEHLQCDEIWTFCLKKQARLKPHEEGNDLIGDQYLFVALDEETKLIPTFLIGKRTAENTCEFMDDLSYRLRGFGPNPDRRMIPMNEVRGAGWRPMISTDGWRPYRDAVDGAFGGAADYGVLIKDYTAAEQPGRYGPPEMTIASRHVIQGNFSKWDICTSHVERHNLSIRTFMRRFTRLALGFSKKLDNLTAATALYIAHYNFCRWHGTLKMTPAMAAKLTGHPWTMEELLTEAGSL